MLLIPHYGEMSKTATLFFRNGIIFGVKIAWIAGLEYIGLSKRGKTCLRRKTSSLTTK
jgi:hypothetical protein